MSSQKIAYTGESFELNVTVVESARWMLSRLLETGLFGRTLSEVTERLVNDRLLQLIEAGWLPPVVTEDTE